MRSLLKAEKLHKIQDAGMVAATITAITLVNK